MTLLQLIPSSSFTNHLTAHRGGVGVSGAVQGTAGSRGNYCTPFGRSDRLVLQPSVRTPDTGRSSTKSDINQVSH